MGMTVKVVQVEPVPLEPVPLDTLSGFRTLAVSYI
jgi:hypothetical protein